MKILFSFSVPWRICQSVLIALGQCLFCVPSQKIPSSELNRKRDTPWKKSDRICCDPRLNFQRTVRLLSFKKRKKNSKQVCCQHTSCFFTVVHQKEFAFTTHLIPFILISCPSSSSSFHHTNTYIVQWMFLKFSPLTRTSCTLDYLLLTLTLSQRNDCQ